MRNLILGGIPEEIALARTVTVKIQKNDDKPTNYSASGAGENVISADDRVDIMFMKEKPWLALRLFIKRKWPRLYAYHSDPRIGWGSCFLKEDTVRRWHLHFKKPKAFDKGAGRHVVCPGRPVHSKDVNGTDFQF